MGAIIPIVLRYLPYLIQASKSIPEITTFISNIHTIFKRSAVWTEDQEAEFDAQTEAMRSDPAWTVVD